MGLKKYPDFPSTWYWIHCGLFVPLWRADQKTYRFAVKFSRCVYLEAVSGKKMLRIQKYLDTGGQGVSFDFLVALIFTLLTNGLLYG